MPKRKRKDEKEKTPAKRKKKEVIIMTPAMKRKHNADKKILQSHPELSSVWEDIKPNLIDQKHQQPDLLRVKLLGYQLEGLNWLKKQEDECKGGLLADEMGMGKTISMISLLVTKKMSPVLIVAPAVAVRQWEEEIKKHVCDPPSICVFHGNRLNDAIHIAQFDVVLTTYSIVESSYRREKTGFVRKGSKEYETSGLHAVKWGRVILDESHYIKDRTTNTARAVFALSGKFKWALSGTPIQNRVGEMYAVIRFLELDPFSCYYCHDCACKQMNWSFSHQRCDHCGHRAMRHFSYWNREILKPIQNFGARGDGLEAFSKLEKILDRYMLRRTKAQKASDLKLPPKHVRIRRDTFNEEEFEFYQSLFSDTKRKFATYVAEGTVLNNYANIFDLLTKMRQASNHPEMVLWKKRSEEERVCGICHDFAEDAVVSKCKHVFCRAEIAQYIGENCPVCFSKLVVNTSTQEIAEPKPTSGILNRIDMGSWKSSTKIEALVEELSRLRSQDHCVKSIVFSQYVSFLDLCHWRLRRLGFVGVKLDGRMTMDQRSNVINAFNTDPHVTVFFISLKAGGVALNLTAASNVFLMDPWWNPAVEEQAMDRIHRLGQYRPINITRMIIADSIEERILELQAKKKALFESTVGKDLDALSRLEVEDLQFLFL